MDDLDPEICAMVYLDWQYRKKWDSYVLGNDVINSTRYKTID